MLATRSPQETFLWWYLTHCVWGIDTGNLISFYEYINEKLLEYWGTSEQITNQPNQHFLVDRTWLMRFFSESIPMSLTCSLHLIHVFLFTPFYFFKSLCWLLSSSSSFSSFLYLSYYRHIIPFKQWLLVFELSFNRNCLKSMFQEMSK